MRIINYWKFDHFSWVKIKPTRLIFKIYKKKIKRITRPIWNMDLIYTSRFPVVGSVFKKRIPRDSCYS